MASINWLSTTKFNQVSVSPAVSMNNENVILASYQSTFIPQPYYRIAKIVIKGQNKSLLFIQDSPTNGPEKLGFDDSIGLADDNSFLSVTEHLLPSGRLTYASGTIPTTGPMVLGFDNHAVIGTDDKFSNPSVGLVSPNRTIVAGTHYSALGLKRRIHLAELKRLPSNGTWTTVGNAVYLADGEHVSIAVNAQNVGVILYMPWNEGNFYLIRLGNVASGTGHWGGATPVQPPPDFSGSSFKIALNDANTAVAAKVRRSLVRCRIGQASSSKFSWLTDDFVVPSRYYSTNQIPRSFEAPHHVAVAINNNYVILVVTTYAVKTKQYKTYFILGELVN